MLIGRFEITDPDEVECSIKIRMKLKEWKELRDQLDHKWPAAELTRAINKMLDKEVD